MRVTRDGIVHALHARRTHYGHLGGRYDFVHVRAAADANDGPWLARLLAIVKVEVKEGIAVPGFLPLAIIQWLNRDPVDLVPGIPTYRYLPDPQAIEIVSIVRPVKLLQSPCAAADGTYRVCALPYGKSAASNALF